MTKQTRRRFSPEYKEQSVARLSQPGATHSSVAAELGVTPTQLKTWRLELEAAGSAAATAAQKAEAAELVQLRRDNKRLPDAGTGQEGYDHCSGRIGEEPPGPDFGVNVIDRLILRSEDLPSPVLCRFA